MGARGPLVGTRVVELASFVSGPFATMMLADLGAEVIKVEAQNGDSMRRFGRAATPVSALFVNLNRGKSSVVLDLKSASGLESLRGLLADADVLVCNWRPAAIDRLGLHDEELAQVNARLVRVYVSGFGRTGPLAEEPAFDSVLQARLGHTEAQGDGARPSLATSYVVDKVTAAMVAQAALAALLERERTGLGDRVDVAMLDAAAYVGYPDVMANRTFVESSAGPAYNRHAAATRPLRTSDGWLVVAPVTGAQVRRACGVVGRPEVVDEVLSMTDPAAMTTRLLDLLEAQTMTAPKAQWAEAFANADVPSAPCLSLDEHLSDDQVVHNELYAVVETPGLGRVRLVRYPAVFGSWGRLQSDVPPPALGEHASPGWEPRVQAR